jgi:hypothetical protein
MRPARATGAEPPHDARGRRSPRKPPITYVVVAPWHEAAQERCNGGMMRQVVVVVSLVVSIGSEVTAFQASGGVAAGKPAIRACSLLTKELVTKVTPRKDTSTLFLVAPQEESLGASGSACEYGGIGLQIDPFTPDRLEELRKQIGKDWTAVPGVGDSAYFRDNSGNFAELYVRVGTRTLTIQMSVPMGSTAAAIKPNTITLANALVPKLR